MSNETELSATKFAELAEVSRQIITRLSNKGTLVKNGSKLDIKNPTNKFYLEGREIKLGKKILENFKPETKKEPIKKKVKISPTFKIKEEVKPKPKPKPKPKYVNNNDSDEEIPLQQQKLKIEVEKLKEQKDKLVRENAVGRAELISKKEVADRLFGYLIALNKNIMGIPLGYIDDFEAAVKSKSTRSEKTNILTIPICEAIEETKIELKKEISRISRELKNG